MIEEKVEGSGLQDYTGIDKPKLNPKNFLGLPITTIAPTDNAPEGTVRIYVDSLSAPTVWRLYIRAAKTWKYKIIDNGA